MSLAPLDDPLSYPGTRAAEPFRLRGQELHRLPDDDPLLTRTDRHAVLAVGSNACPAQLARKFRGRPCSDEVVGFPVRVTGLQVRPSAHLGRSGYWPFAPVPLDDSVTTAVLGLFDDDQLAVLDATEPNYARTPLERGRHRLSRMNGISVTEPVEVYASRHGVVDDARLPAWSEPPPTQEQLLSALLPLLREAGDAVPATVADAASLSLALRSQEGLAARLTDALKRTVVVRRWP